MEKKSLHDELRNLVDKYEEMAKKMGGSSLVEQLFNCTDQPYSAEVMAIPLPSKLKVLQIEMYDGSRDPVDHLKNFKVHMTLHGFPGKIACRAFRLTLKGMALGWFGALRPGSINSFEELAKQFLAQFMASRRC